MHKQLGVHLNSRPIFRKWPLSKRAQHAGGIFQSLLMCYTSGVSRRTDDNVYQLLQNKYLFTLREKLAATAQAVVLAHRLGGNVEVMRALSASINYFINEFKRKCALM